MSAFLLTWKPDEWGYEKLRARLDAHAIGEVVQRCSCGRTKNIPVGSRELEVSAVTGRTQLEKSLCSCVGSTCVDHYLSKKSD